MDDASRSAMKCRVTIASVASFAFPTTALAHNVETAIADGALRWSFEPWVLICLALSALLYGMGTARLWSRAGRGRGVSRMQVACFVAGWLTLIAALVSPLDALGTQLFS